VQILEKSRLLHVTGQHLYLGHQAAPGNRLPRNDPEQSLAAQEPESRGHQLHNILFVMRPSACSIMMRVVVILLHIVQAVLHAAAVAHAAIEPANATQSSTSTKAAGATVAAAAAGSATPVLGAKDKPTALPAGAVPAAGVNSTQAKTANTKAAIIVTPTKPAAAAAGGNVTSVKQAATASGHHNGTKSLRAASVTDGGLMMLNDIPTNVSANVALASKNHTLGVGSVLRPYAQCGGAGGWCNSTSIGIPCADEAWFGALCPKQYVCHRQDPLLWICLPLGLKPHTSNATNITTAAGANVLVVYQGQVNATNITDRGSGRAAQRALELEQQQQQKDAAAAKVSVATHCKPGEVAFGSACLPSSSQTSGVMSSHDTSRTLHWLVRTTAAAVMAAIVVL
jgi:hypothetical protein